jgi:hypothetical protein
MAGYQTATSLLNLIFSTIGFIIAVIIIAVMINGIYSCRKELQQTNDLLKKMLKLQSPEPVVSPATQPFSGETEKEWVCPECGAKNHPGWMNCQGRGCNYRRPQ